MMCRVRPGARRAAHAAFLSVFLAALLATSTGQLVFAAPRTLPAHVSATYKISFSVLGDIGTFRFSSSIDADAYALAADATIDTAVFDYNGVMASTGSVLAAVTKPGDYKFRYKQKAVLGKKKKRSLNIAFNGGGVTGVYFEPPDPPSKKAIPVTEAQLRNVLDPLSGVMALSLGDSARPCDQKIPIYDGKQRFDIIFTPARPSAGPGTDQLCHVRLVPISGHKPGEGTDKVISGQIEVVLRPVPKANILIPYRVTVPTIVGSAVLTSEKVDITMPDRQRIAFRR
jgi:hypothetical protein